MNIRLIAFDLDGTLLRGHRFISDEDMRALRAAAERGILLVPASGRLYSEIPPELKALPTLRYCITVNGAFVYDSAAGKNIYSAELSSETVCDILAYAGTQDVFYDCYMDNRVYINRFMLDNLGRFVPDSDFLAFVRSVDIAVEDLSAFLSERGGTVQKLQLYTACAEDKARISRELETLFPNVSVTSSLPLNIEINDRRATKGQALAGLCAAVGIDSRDVIAFGDGTNDIDLLRTAGLGIAMGNAHPDVKAAADLVTDTNDNSGIAKALAAYL